MLFKVTKGYLILIFTFILNTPRTFNQYSSEANITISINVRIGAMQVGRQSHKVNKSLHVKLRGL